jgi:DNA-binding PadR family transcriptional regulator
MKSSKLDNLLSNFSRFYILTILYEGPAHGYEIMSKFKARVGKTLSPGLIYPFLGLLEERNYVSHKSKMNGEKESKIYHLTEEGRNFTTKNFIRFAGIVSTALEQSLEVCAHCGCKVYEGAHIEEIDGVPSAFCCVHCARHYKHENIEETFTAQSIRSIQND